MATPVNCLITFKSALDISTLTTSDISLEGSVLANCADIPVLNILTPCKYTIDPSNELPNTVSEKLNSSIPVFMSRPKLKRTGLVVSGMIL